MFVIQNGFVGNAMIFWMKTGGYGCDLSEAKIWTKEEALATVKECASSHQFVAWPFEYVYERQRKIVEGQDCTLEEAGGFRASTLPNPTRRR